MNAMHSGFKKPPSEQNNDHDDDVIDSDLDTHIPLQSKHLKNTAPHSYIALHVVGIYIVLWAIGATILSDTFLLFIGVAPETLPHLTPYKRWVFLLITAPTLYWVAAKYAAQLQTRNNELEAIKKKISRLNAMHRMLGEIHRDILRIPHKEPLLKEVCNVIHKQGKFAFVWIGLGETQAMLPKVIIYSGADSHYLQDLFNGLHLASAQERGEPSLSALRKKNYIVINELNDTSAHVLSWQKRAIAHHFNAIAAFPFKTSTGLAGVVGIYSAEAGVFTPEEIILFNELADNLSSGLSDIERKEQVYYAAHFDVLTNLPNKQLFEDTLEQSLLHAAQHKTYCGVAIIDVLPLHPITDANGQMLRDKLLQTTATELTKLIRLEDTIARITETQLSILLSDRTHAQEIAVTVESLSRCVSLQVRIGAAIYPKDGSTAKILIQHAQEALRRLDMQSKIRCALYIKQFPTEGMYIQNIQEALQGSLERQEWVIHYQPIVDLVTGEPQSYEAILQWHHPLWGEILPFQFMPIVEEMPMLSSLKEWVLQSVCQQLLEWQKQGKPNKLISVYISAKELTHPDFIHKIKTLFDSIQFDPKKLNLAIEVHEDILVDSPGQILEIFHALKALGLKIVVNHFGTGYASLHYLHQLPVNALKIDPLFIHKLNRDLEVKNLIKGIVIFAASLGLEVIAEGVETQKQIDDLKALGCMQGQGYCLSAPLS